MTGARRLLLVRHGRPERIPGAPPASWPLAGASHHAVRLLGRRLRVDGKALLVSSTEPKAIATAHALGIGAGLQTSDDLREVAKPWFDDPAGLERATSDYLRGAELPGWEPLALATERFDRVIGDLDHDRPAVVVTHGTRMTAWLAWRGLVTDGLGFWLGLTQPDAWEASRHPPSLERLLE